MAAAAAAASPPPLGPAGALPVDVLQAVLQFLPARHWGAAALVCTCWAQAILASAQAFTLLAAYENLPSPPRVVPDGVSVPGLSPTTQLHPYQLQTLQAMLQREVRACAPESAALARDPTLFSLLPGCPANPGHRLGDGDHSGDAGGILGEDMGTGKTLVCLALVLKTKGVWSAVPNVVVPEWDTGFDPPVACYAEYVSRGRTAPAIPHHSRVWTSHTTLVVVPKLLVDQWIEEINAHTVPHALAVRVCRTHGDIARLTVPQVLHTDLLLVAQSAIRPEFRGLRRFSNDSSPAVLPTVSALSNVRFWRIIIDEGHTMGRGASCQTAAIAALAADIRWVCSGTPFPGTTLGRQLEHLGALMNFLRVSPYNSTRYWIQHVRRPLLRRLPDAPCRLLEALKRVMVRTQPAAVAQDVALPELTVREVRLPFRDAEEAARYNEVVSLVRVNLLASRGVGPDSFLDVRNSRELLVAINNLSYVCTTGEEFAGYRDSQAVAEAEVRSLLSTGHTSDGLPLDAADRMELQRLLVALSQRRLPRPSLKELLDSKEAGGAPRLCFSAKVEYLMERLQALVPRHKCIVFTRDNDAIVVLRAALTHWGLDCVAVEFHALIPIDCRSGVITAFNYDPTVRIIVMNTLLAAEGISLTAADRLFLLEPLLDRHVEGQAVARAHRIGQLRPVVMEKLIVQGTLEDALAQRLAEARDLPWTVSSLARALVRTLRMADVRGAPPGRALPTPQPPPALGPAAGAGPLPRSGSSSSDRTAALKRRRSHVYAPCTEGLPPGRRRRSRSMLPPEAMIVIETEEAPGRGAVAAHHPSRTTKCRRRLARVAGGSPPRSAVPSGGGAAVAEPGAEHKALCARPLVVRLAGRSFETQLSLPLAAAVVVP